jgi:hypothetical protein
MTNWHGTVSKVDKKEILAFFQLVRQFEIENRKWKQWQFEHYLGTKRLAEKEQRVIKQT